MANLHVRWKWDPGVVMYLIIIDQIRPKYKDILMARPTEKFQNMVHKEVMAHVIDGKEPPPEIHSAILNISDDMMAGREIALRAGDYIALMNYARENKLL